ncbi:hypothetical protein RIR_jg14584.t1 [Rhizophagus irregularis DAOM 181602=DAOM 197198]|nr:hypothetical protein RIR_jg14584.t1 [Rhizophagus irregularis DAOM 181602=DAOM 197198]
MKLKYVKIKDNWHFNSYTKNPNLEFKYFTDNKVMLLKLGEETKEILLKQINKKIQLILIIIDGVDGVKKTTIVNNIIKKIEAQNLKIIFNTFKRRRGDNKLFETHPLNMNSRCFIKK